ncbi:peptidase S8/S53 domain-containing protein [Mycena maculata]|uniref:Peptidase S8/S53 domain-containing protein n=1 Tax=Mycena maculata TaxID=230809 RepID=A0AAD7N4R6_9AGAR|nr:peptidase S8/S53 domain-containing protein [Mycena maculata]
MCVAGLIALALSLPVLSAPVLDVNKEVHDRRVSLAAGQTSNPAKGPTTTRSVVKPATTTTFPKKTPKLRSTKTPRLPPTSKLPAGCSRDLRQPSAIPNSTITHVPDEIPGRYTVVLDNSADLRAHLTQLQSFIDANKHCTTLNNTVDNTADHSFLKFYAGKFDGRVLGYISKIQGVQNLARITHGSGPLLSGPAPATGPKSATSTDWTYSIGDGANGDGVAIYIVDSGIRTSHPEFTGRVVQPGTDYRVHGVPTTDDTVGHGDSFQTAVASVAAGSSVGVANKATLFPMRVLMEYTETETKTVKTKISEDSVSGGISNAVDHYQRVWNGGRTSGVMKPVVINVSLWLRPDFLVKTVITAAINAGIHVVICAGNQGGNYHLPDLGQITVGATDIDDKKAGLSNFGPCVDIYAPGASIEVADLDSGLRVDDGTSFATSLVSGMVAATISSTGNMSPADMKKQIIADAKGKMVDFTFANSQNHLALMEPKLTNLTRMSGFLHSRVWIGPKFDS